MAIKYNFVLCFSSAWMMSFNSCRVMSACSRALPPPTTTHIAHRGILVDTGLQVLEDGWIDAGHLGKLFESVERDVMVMQARAGEEIVRWRASSGENPSSSATIFFVTHVFTRVSIYIITAHLRRDRHIAVTCKILRTHFLAKMPKLTVSVDCPRLAVTVPVIS